MEDLFYCSYCREVTILSHNAGGSASLKRVSLSTAKIGNILYRELFRRLGPGGYHWTHYVEFSSSNAEWFTIHQVILEGEYGFQLSTDFQTRGRDYE